MFPDIQRDPKTVFPAAWRICRPCSHHLLPSACASSPYAEVIVNIPASSLVNQPITV
jgi:hypothetical protein